MAEQLHQSRPEMPQEYIEESVMEWLEDAYMPEDIVDGDEEEKLQHQIEAWVEAHNESRETSVYG